MSLEMIERWKSVQASPTQRFVGWILSDSHNGKTGQCNPSIARIVKLTGFSERTVIQAIHDLEKAGHISVRRVTGERSNYILHPCISRTPEADAPLKESKETPDPPAPNPLPSCTTTPDPPAPKTGIEPEGEPEPTGRREWEVDYSANGNPRMIQRIVKAYPSQAGKPIEAERALGRLATEGADLNDILKKVLVHRERYEALPDDRKGYCPRIHTYFEQCQFNVSPDIAPWVYFGDPNRNGNRNQSKRPEPTPQEQDARLKEREENDRVNREMQEEARNLWEKGLAAIAAREARIAEEDGQ